jgi:hypothetical protein
MEKSKCIFYKEEEFSNSEEVGGILAAREKLESLKSTNKPFLEKHPEYEEDYEFDVKELTTDLRYFIYNKDIYGSKEDRGTV